MRCNNLSFVLQGIVWYALDHWCTWNFTNVAGPWIFMTFLSHTPVYMCHTRASRINWTAIRIQFEGERITYEKMQRIFWRYWLSIWTLEFRLLLEVKGNLYSGQEGKEFTWEGVTFRNMCSPLIWRKYFGMKKAAGADFWPRLWEFRKLLNKGIKVAVYKPNECCWL